MFLGMVERDWKISQKQSQQDPAHHLVQASKKRTTEKKRTKKRTRENIEMEADVELQSIRDVVTAEKLIRSEANARADLERKEMAEAIKSIASDLKEALLRK